MPAPETEIQMQEQAPAIPTDEQVMDVLEGKGDTQVEQAENAATPKTTEATVPAVQTPSALTEERLRELLSPLNSELGQLRKLRSEFDKLRAQPNTKPTESPKAWSEMSPEQQAAWDDLNKHWFQRTYGDTWQKMQSRFEQMESSERMGRVEEIAKEFGGDAWKELDPIMGRIFNDLQAKAETDPASAELLEDVMSGRRAGVNMLVTLAKQELSNTVKAKEGQAKTAQEAQAKRVATTLNSTPTATAETGDEALLANLPSDPGKAKAILEAELKRRGFL